MVFSSLFFELKRYFNYLQIQISGQKKAAIAAFLLQSPQQGSP
jgi:hypothetical protein